ncbi:MAG: DMP19 family protein [Clostridia bacterium]|nr:DMP19 family protein [Clostridia bacterium]
MKLFDLFKQKDMSKEEKSNIDHIWSLTDANDFVIAMVTHLDNKTNYGDNMSVLSEAERIFYVTQSLEMEVNNGGFSQFFFNSSGNFANELVSAFTAIGAIETATICQKAISAFGRDIPVDRDEREEMLEELESDEIAEILTECDNAFYEYKDNLNELNYNFAVNNKHSFT